MKGHNISLTAVQTMLKMMKNMAAKASEDKFKRVRLGNANFHTKVGGVDGGLEVSQLLPRGGPCSIRGTYMFCLFGCNARRGWCPEIRHHIFVL